MQTEPQAAVGVAVVVWWSRCVLCGAWLQRDCETDTNRSANYSRALRGKDAAQERRCGAMRDARCAAIHTADEREGRKRRREASGRKTKPEGRRANELTTT